MAPAELADDTDAVERKLHCMSIKGYRHCNPSVVDLDKTLNAIKETLRAEQKRVVELNLVAVFRVMSPIQVQLRTASGSSGMKGSGRQACG